jgi:hypothetical protein
VPKSLPAVVLRSLPDRLMLLPGDFRNESAVERVAVPGTLCNLGKYKNLLLNH